MACTNDVGGDFDHSYAIAGIIIFWSDGLRTEHLKQNCKKDNIEEANGLLNFGYNLDQDSFSLVKSVETYTLKTSGEIAGFAFLKADGSYLQST